MKDTLSFNWRFKNYWITTVHDNWLNANHDYDRSTAINKNCPIELCKYNSDGNTRYALAFFKRDDEGYELHSVGGRLFEDIDADEIGDIWRQLQAAQKMLDAYWEASYYNE